MLILLIGFITPAIVFAIFGIIACLRRSTFASVTENDEDKEYQLIESSAPIRVHVPKPERGYFGFLPPIGYQNFFPAPSMDMPPSYSEATSIPLLAREPPTFHVEVVNETRRASHDSISSQPSQVSKHLPRNQPRVRPSLSISPIEQQAITF